MKGYVRNESGDLGEEFSKEYCEQKNILFKKATKTEDLKYGIDAYIKDLPTDIKNTKDIYFLQMSNDGEFNTRHPFKEETKATHYFFVNVNKEHKEFIEFISIKEKLLRDFIKSEECLNNFLNFVKELDNESYDKFGINYAEACLTIKNKLLSYLKENVILSYEEPKDKTISFKLMKKEEKQITKKNIFDAKSLIRKNLENMQKKPVKTQTDEKEDVIKIKI